MFHEEPSTNLELEVDWLAEWHSNGNAGMIAGWDTMIDDLSDDEQFIDYDDDDIYVQDI